MTFSLSIYRKESSFNLGSAETKLLLTMHWIMVDAPDECILETADKNPVSVETGPFAYLFPLSAITVSKETLAWLAEGGMKILRRSLIANRSAVQDQISANEPAHVR